MNTMGADKRHTSVRGFSMAELLIVIALIAIMATGIGVAFRGGDSSTALVSAQSTLGALFTSAQLQATTSGREVYVMVDMTPGNLNNPNTVNQGYLRRFVTFRHTSTNASGAKVFNAIGKPVFLPQGAYLSPPQGMDDGFEWEADVDIRRRTMGGDRHTAFGITLPTGYTGTWYGWKFSPSGRIEVQGSDMVSQIVLVAGNKVPPTNYVRVAELDAYQSRGVKISYYGQVSMVDYFNLFYK